MLSTPQQHLVRTDASPGSRPIVTITASAAASVAAAAAAAISSDRSTHIAVAPQDADKTEINEAVAKVLQGYDWTLVPIATK
ncbi:hypothetical protein C0J52_18781 [Blattella germanica]|nr:hypothetical protein C0J52_18781 [Blattella germanica]